MTQRNKKERTKRTQRCGRCGASWRDQPSCGKTIHASLPERPIEEQDANSRAWAAVDRAEAAEAKAKAAAKAAHKANPDSDNAKDAADRWAETSAHKDATIHAAQGSGMDTSDEQRNRAADRATRCAINAEESAIEAGWHQQEAEAEATEQEDGDDR